MIDKLFIYGTLLSCFNPVEELSVRFGIQFLERGEIQGRLYDLGDYPAVVEDSSGEWFVCGELYQVKDPGRMLRVLDEFEAYDPEHPEQSAFQRRPIDVFLKSGQIAKAWIYVYNRPLDATEAVAIESGDYEMYVRQRRSSR